MIKRILWAVDPYAEDAELQRRTAEVVKAVICEKNVTVEPVSIVHWEEGYVIPGEAAQIENLKNTAIARIGAIVASCQMKQVISPTVLVQNNLSLGDAVRRLLQHAEATQADLIAVGTLAKKGSTRFLMGSFAESLILTSRLPTLVVSPHAGETKKIENILFPSDLSPKSKDAFPLVMELAQETGAQITVFHRVEYLTRTPQSLLPALTGYSSEFKEQIAKKEEQADGLVSLAKQRGLKAKLLVQSHGAGTVESIVALTKDLPSTIVAMVSQTASMDSMLLGSVTRQILRSSLCPVWVIHPKK